MQYHIALDGSVTLLFEPKERAIAANLVALINAPDKLTQERKQQFLRDLWKNTNVQYFKTEVT